MLNIDLLPELPDAICHSVAAASHALPAEPVPWAHDLWQDELLDEANNQESAENSDQRRELCFETCELSKEELEAPSLDNLVHLGVRKRGGRHWTCNQGQLIAA